MSKGYSNAIHNEIVEAQWNSKAKDAVASSKDKQASLFIVGAMTFMIGIAIIAFSTMS